MGFFRGGGDYTHIQKFKHSQEYRSTMKMGQKTKSIKSHFPESYLCLVLSIYLLFSKEVALLWTLFLYYECLWNVKYIIGCQLQTDSSVL